MRLCGPSGPSRAWAVLLVGLVVGIQSTSAKAARSNGDPLEVGEQVRIRVLVEEDSYFGVVACGEHQCGGVRVEGVDNQGMGYKTFVSNATNRPFRAKWVVKRDDQFGNAFALGKEYEFVVARPDPNQMQLWMAGREDRVASVHLHSDVAKLHVAFRNGAYRFIGEPKESKPTSAKIRAECAGIKEKRLVREEGADILEIKSACRFESEDKGQPMCIVYLVVDGVKGKEEVYRSRMARDEYDPEQEETLHLPFRFEENQYLVFEVYKAYSDCDTPDQDDALGSLQTPLASANVKGNVEVTVTGPNGEKYSARFQRNCDQRINLQFSGRSLDGDGDVFLEIVKTPAKKGQSDEEVLRTSAVKRDTDLTLWDEMSLSVNAICDGDYDRVLRVYVMETSGLGNSLVGYFNTTLNELKEPKRTYLLTNHAKQAAGSTNHSGQMWVGEIPQNVTFSQYVAVGFELIGTTQIDFTASNNEPVPSLHNIGDGPNKYEVAIKAVGEVVEKFIANHIFRAYGFGVNFNGQVSHDFNLNLESESPDCVGVAGLLKTYHETVKKLWTREAGYMYGPTYFSPGLKKVTELAKQYQDGSKYFVHLLLTDGILEDSNETKQVILEAQKLPISIIIVGIGAADFSLVEEVARVGEGNNSQGATEYSKGVTRDIAQFVAIRDFLGAGGDGQEVALRRKVLSKIPQQYLEYMKIKKIPPKPPKNTTIEHYCA